MLLNKFKLINENALKYNWNLYFCVLFKTKKLFMNTFLHILAITFISTLSINAFANGGDDFFKPKGKLSSLPERYRSLGLKFGPRTLNTDPGTIVTSFLDESPAPDFFSANTMVADKYSSFGLQLDYSWRRYKGLSHSLFVDLSLGENFGGLFEYSIGWSIPVALGNSFLIVRPNIGLGFGNYGFKLGSIENRTGYIQVDETIFQEKLVPITLKSQVFLYSPQLDLRYTLSSNFHITAQVSYDVASGNSNPKLYFEGESSSAEKKIDTDNPSVIFNGEKITSLPYKAGGIRLSLGAAYTWNID